MDAKEFWLITQLHSTIESGSFTERDILALLITLRNHTRKDNLVREFGDFIAHREKDRGILKEYLSSIQSSMNSKSSNTAEVVFKVHTSESIQNSFNEVFRSLGLSELNLEVANQITVCIISLLQSVEIKIEDLVASVPKLLIGVTYEYIALLGQGKLPTGHIMAFPVLIASNKYVNLPSNVTQYMILDHVVETYSVNGDLYFLQRAPAA